VDKLALELIALFQELLTAHERQLTLAKARLDAMRAYDLTLMTSLAEREEHEVRNLEVLEARRKDLIARIKRVLGTEPTTTLIAARLNEPLKSQLLGLAGRLKTVLEQADRVNRINAKISQSVIKSLAKVLKIVTGVAQHVGLYTRNGRKAALAGIHILEMTA
jgi:hypothetical protein